MITEKRATQLVGKSLKRKEDQRFMVGSSKFVDDIKLPGMLHAYVVRSPYAHSKIDSIDIQKALKYPGVYYVYTSADIEGKVGTLPTATLSGNHKPVPRPPLAKDMVNYVGEPVAFVVAENRYIAEDAAEMVEVSYTTLDSITDPDIAIRPESSPLHQGLESNVGNYLIKEGGNVDEAFKSADKIVRVDIVNQRVAPSPMEPRAIVASYDPGTNFLTAWMGNQQPFETRVALAETLHIDENRIRVVAPDVGGAFGAKCYLYSEDVMSCFASMDSKRPVKWIETRSENLSTMVHGRGQNQSAEVAVRNDGKILGLKVKIVSDSGAYASPETFGDPEVTVDMIPAIYDIKNYRAELYCVYTNKVSFDAYRGAGRPEATYLIERIIDRISKELDIDPAEVRLKNFIKENSFPYKTVTGYTYDSGDYQTNLRRALEFINYNRWRLEQREERAKASNGRLIGIGLGNYVDISTWGPDMPQTASITVTMSGKIKVVAGTSPHGQGHETPFAQIVSDELGVDVDKITVVYGDTDRLPWGSTTGGSRSGALGGSAVLISARKIKEKMAQIAGKELGVEPASLQFENGKIFQKYNPEKSLTFEAVAAMAYVPSKIPAGMESTLFAYSAFSPENWTFPYGTHIAVVEVERETGMIKVLEYVAVDDIGMIINPLIAQGQIHGGVVQGAGQALLEGIIYDQNGNLLTSSFMDYQIPESCDSFPIRWDTTFTATRSNPLGVKGVGENGALAGTPAIVNAVEDALSVVNAKVKTMPLTPHYVLGLLNGGYSGEGKN
jgi:carbon-monoxide dehydrogenase large subunit